MPLTAGALIGQYEIGSALGAGGMSACGHAEPRPVKPRRGISVSSRRGWGPAGIAKMFTPSPCR
jgi:hypothetical protein